MQSKSQWCPHGVVPTCSEVDAGRGGLPDRIIGQQMNRVEQFSGTHRFASFAKQTGKA